MWIYIFADVKDRVQRLEREPLSAVLKEIGYSLTYAIDIKQLMSVIGSLVEVLAYDVFGFSKCLSVGQVKSWSCANFGTEEVAIL
jgi:hypothetical protein